MGEIKRYHPFIHSPTLMTSCADGDYRLNSDYEVLEAKIKELEHGYGYASRLHKELCPNCEPLPDLPGLMTQFDNYITGLHDVLKIYADPKNYEPGSINLLDIMFDRGARAREAMQGQFDELPNYQKEIKRYRTALEFYANKDKWYDILDASVMPHVGFVDRKDKGQKAQAALHPKEDKPYVMTSGEEDVIAKALLKNSVEDKPDE